VEHVERHPLCLVAVNAVAGVFAVMQQNAELAIFDYQRHIAAATSTELNRTKVYGDANIDYCHLLWSDSSQLLIFARSVPVVDIFDVHAAFYYNVTLVWA
jgi:hypothetical protein